MTLLRTLWFVRVNLETALEAAIATRNDKFGRNFLHVSREKVEVSDHFLRKALEA